MDSQLNFTMESANEGAANDEEGEMVVSFSEMFDTFPQSDRETSRLESPPPPPVEPKAAETPEPTTSSGPRRSTRGTDSYAPPFISYQDGTSPSVTVTDSRSEHLKKLYVDETGYKFVSSEITFDRIQKALCETKKKLEHYANDSLPTNFQGSAYAVVRLKDRSIQQLLADDRNDVWKKECTRRTKVPSTKMFVAGLWWRHSSDSKFCREIYYRVKEKSNQEAVTDYAIVHYSWRGVPKPILSKSASSASAAQPSSQKPSTKRTATQSELDTRSASSPAVSYEQDGGDGCSYLSAIALSEPVTAHEPEIGSLPSTSSNETTFFGLQEGFRFSETPSLEQIRQLHDKFVNDRGWNDFHTPRNLLLAMVGEVGEVSELFQWKGECKERLPDWSAKEKRDLGEELSDVLIYLIRLAQKCNVDLPKAVERKMQLNALKYPAEVVYGSSKKYTDYQRKNSKNDE